MRLLLFLFTLSPLYAAQGYRNVPIEPFHVKEAEELEYASLYQACRVMKRRIEILHQHEENLQDKVKAHLRRHLLEVNSPAALRLLNTLEQRDFHFMY